MILLSDDFIDEAQVRFARATTKDLARYIERATIEAYRSRKARRRREQIVITTDYRKGTPCS